MKFRSSNKYGPLVGRGLLIAFALVLSACSSTGSAPNDSSERQTIVENSTENSTNENAFDDSVFDESMFDDSMFDDAIPQRSVDSSIELNLDQVPERIARGYERAHMAMAAQNWSEAELELEQLILDEPGFPGAYVNLAIVYRHTGRLTDARFNLEQALAIDPAFAPASNELGLLLRESGEFRAAESAYRNAVAADPSYAIAQYNLGILLDLYLRRPADALPHYTAYQDLLVEPDEKVGRWIIDVERRARTAAERVAQD